MEVRSSGRPDAQNEFLKLRAQKTDWNTARAEIGSRSSH